VAIEDGDIIKAGQESEKAADESGSKFSKGEIMSQSQDEKSLGELVADLAQGTSTLVRQEVQLAKTEITQHISAGIKGIIFLIVAAGFGFVAFLTLVTAAVLALSLILAPWLAALLVGLLLLIAGVLIPSALGNLKKLGEPPQQTLETIKEDAQWIKQQTK
jgi:hypothetical protein